MQHNALRRHAAAVSILDHIICRILALCFSIMASGAAMLGGIRARLDAMQHVKAFMPGLMP